MTLVALFSMHVDVVLCPEIVQLSGPEKIYYAQA